MALFLAYHNPCVDGVYSLFTSFLFFREIQLQDIPPSLFMDYIDQFEKYEDINHNIFQYRQKKSESQSETKEEYKIDTSKKFKNEYSPSILEGIIYVPIKLDSLGTFTFPYKHYTKAFLKKSVLILMDHSGSNAESIIEAGDKFRKVIIIDHHVTFENYLEEIKKVIKNSIIKYINLNRRKNIQGI